MMSAQARWSDQGTHVAFKPAGLGRRLGAMVSDSLAIFAVLALLTLVVFVPVLSVLGKKAIAPAEVGWTVYLVYWGCMLGAWFAFCGYFWHRGGQTIGMRAWRIQVISVAGASLSWRDALRRWVAGWIPWLPGLGCLGLADHLASEVLKYVGEGLLLGGVAGLLSLYRSPLGQTWHDRVSRSRVIFLG
jgi:uncharacterized RDD family membrane protein YckC